MNYILFAIPVFFLTIGIELFVGWYRKEKYYKFDDTITNLTIGVGSEATGLFYKVAILNLYACIFTQAAIVTLPINVVTVIVAVVVFDFIYYWAHRWGHEWNFFWGAHIVHHQSQQYNLSVALRQSWIHSMIAFMLFLPMALLGFHPYLVAGAGAFVTLFQYWIHTKAINKMPRWFEFVFNSPSHHRVHHAINPQYLDKNYAAVFILWDRLFGTFEPEVEMPRYGTTTPINSWNPVWANVIHYWEMLLGGKKMKSLWRAFKLNFQAPEYLGKLLKIRSQDYREVPVYETPVSNLTKAYILVQFLLLNGALLLFMIHFYELSWLSRILGFGLIIWTSISMGALMERKPWAPFGEVCRILAAASFLNVLYHFQYPEWFVIMLVGSVVIGLTSLVFTLVRWRGEFVFRTS